ncbi:hypothetical protein HUS23_00460 [Ectothiorhodospiraceae bacterium 2226]|nr:hypothetical protein HUS23_00460 [Ectothiorhodospiraceae bacterium 2226]
MALDATFIITALAVATILYALWAVVSLSSSIPGGIVGRQWAILSGLVVLFTFGYLVAPFFRVLPDEVLRFVVALIFLFGAVYVVITIKLVHRVIQVLTE